MIPEDGRAALEAFLAGLGIAALTVEHPPVHTVEEALPHWADLEGEHTKNLFLKDARGGLWLIALRAERRADLKALAQRLEAKKFSFASAELLAATLGVLPGAVSPLALINDTGKRVRLVLDRALLRGGAVTFHPLVNTATTALRIEDFRRFLAALGRSLEAIELDPAG